LSQKIKHIAVIRLSAMGDVAMTVPVIRALVAQYPQLQVTIVSRPFFKAFFEGIPNLHFFEVDLKHRHKGFKGLINLFHDLISLGVDAIADLHNVLRSKVVRTLFALKGAKIAYTDKGRADKKALTRAQNKVFKPLKTMFDSHVETFEKLGFPIDLYSKSNANLFPPKAVLSETILNITGDKQAYKWIGIAPFAQYEGKVYPKDLMQQVIDNLASHSNYKIFLFGGGSAEQQALEVFAQGKNNVINLVGKLQFAQELQLISNLDLMLSMDSGNGHIAAMLGLKVITLWGATHPYAGFVPFNQPLDYCLMANRTLYPLLPTSIYGNKVVEGYHDAMRSISPQSITDTITHLL